MKSKSKLSDFRQQESNLNKHTQRGMGMLESSMQEVGYAGPMVAAADGEIIDGSARHETAANVFGPDAEPIIVDTDGKRPVIVRRTDIPNAKTKLAKRLAVFANRTAEVNLEWDTTNVADLLAADAEAFNGMFAEDEIRDLLKGTAGEIQPVDAEPQMDKAKALQKKWGTKLNQLWQLGDHKILCGDSTKRENLDALFGSDLVDMVFTDPPYGHNNNDGDLIHNWEKALGHKQTKSSAARPIANDSAEDSARTVKAIFAEAARLLKPGGCCCCCGGGGGGPDPQFARWSLWLDAAIPFKMCVVWDKGGLGMGWHYRRNWECILVAQQSGAKCKWNGGNDTPNVIRDIGKIIPQADDHPTPKPVELSAWFIRLHTDKGDTVFEPMVGGGSTLIACENLGRRCMAVELDAGYVAVCLERFKTAFPSKEIKLLS